MGNCFAQHAGRAQAGLLCKISALLQPPGTPSISAMEEGIPILRQQINKDMRRIMGDSYFNRFKVTSKVLSKMELSKACEFVELQMLLPRRYCVDTQVLVLTSAQLACCGMFLHQPFLTNQTCFVQALSLHVLFDPRSMVVEAYAVALATLARSLEGNLNLRRLTINLMGIAFVKKTERSARLFTAVLNSFAAMLCCNNTIRLLRFEGMIGEDEDLPWDARDACFVRKAQTLQAKSTRMVFLMGRHLRCRGASKLARNLPNDLAAKILDMAAPLRASCKVEFDFCRDSLETLIG